MFGVFFWVFRGCLVVFWRCLRMFRGVVECLRVFGVVLRVLWSV